MAEKSSSVPDNGQNGLKATGSGLPRPLRSSRRRLGEYLLERRLVTLQQLNTALDAQAKSDRSFLGQILVDMGYLPSRELGAILHEISGVPHVDLATYAIDPEAARLLPQDLERDRIVLPLRVDEERLWLAMADPLDLDTIDAVRLQTGKIVVPLLALQSELLPLINRSYDVRERAEQAIREIDNAEADDEADNARDLMDQAANAPIVRLVNTIIEGAFSSYASDVHMEPQEDGLRVRFRIDGLLTEQMKIPRVNQAAVVSRIKVMAKMDIAERRRPQDGRVGLQYQGRAYDLRVSIMPTLHGEKVVMRVLDKAAMMVSLERIGFWPDELALWNRLINRPYGMVLVTGPTGSGKSTTLYSSLNQINDPAKNITTVEDPVEYQLPGINQTQVNVRAGITFAAGLRTLVRQDPDIILVGEVRDTETAEVAVNAALTGHLVFATLHTNDAPGAVVRLDNMGIEPFLIASSLLGVLGQRLVRKVCDNCKEWYIPDAEVLQNLGIPVENSGEPVRLARGVGCQECGGKGYRGRSAVFEIMTMTDTVRALVLQRASASVVKAQAITEGMQPMRVSANRKVLAGITTPEEVARVLLAEE